MKTIISLVLAFLVFVMGLAIAAMLDNIGADPIVFWLAGIVGGVLIMACFTIGD